MKQGLANIAGWMQSFFQEDGAASTTRFMSVLWVITLCANLTFVTIYNAIKLKDGAILDLPDIPTMYLMTTTVFLGAKVGQKVFGEKSPLADKSEEQKGT